jgi:hypothetical protein
MTPRPGLVKEITTEILNNNSQILFAKGGAAHQKPGQDATTAQRWAEHLKTLRCCCEKVGMSVGGGYYVRGFCVELARTKKGLSGIRAKSLIKPWEDEIIEAIKAVEAAGDIQITSGVSHAVQSSNHQDDKGGTGGKAPIGACEGIVYIVGGYLVYDPQ